MPIREYQCQNDECLHKWEEIRPNQTDPKQCPKCWVIGGIKRLFSVPARLYQRLT